MVTECCDWKTHCNAAVSAKNTNYSYIVVEKWKSMKRGLKKKQQQFIKQIFLKPMDATSTGSSNDSSMAQHDAVAMATFMEKYEDLWDKSLLYRTYDELLM